MMVCLMSFEVQFWFWINVVIPRFYAMMSSFIPCSNSCTIVNFGLFSKTLNAYWNLNGSWGLFWEYSTIFILKLYVAGCVFHIDNLYLWLCWSVNVHHQFHYITNAYVMQCIDDLYRLYRCSTRVRHLMFNEEPNMRNMYFFPECAS